MVRGTGVWRADRVLGGLSGAKRRRAVLGDAKRRKIPLKPGAIEVLFRVRDRLSCYHRPIKSPVFEKSPVLGEKLSRRGGIFKAFEFFFMAL